MPADCVLPTRTSSLHAARPAGVNEPRPEGVAGTERILEVVASLGPDDLCICLLSGGGSALIPAPVPGISLDDKIGVAQLLSSAGANITQLNTVRSQLSLVKGGGLARACHAGRLVSLIISDVLGDPLDVDRLRANRRVERNPGRRPRRPDQLKLSGHPELHAVIRYLPATGRGDEQLFASCPRDESRDRQQCRGGRCRRLRSGAARLFSTR